MTTTVILGHRAEDALAAYRTASHRLRIAEQFVADASHNVDLAWQNFKEYCDPYAETYTIRNEVVARRDDDRGLWVVDD